MAKAVKTKAKVTKKVTRPKKPAAVKRAAAKKTKPSAAQSSFLEVRVTDQTLYWLIFGTAAILFTMWLFTLDSRVRDLYDQIDANMHSSSIYQISNKTQPKKQ